MGTIVIACTTTKGQPFELPLSFFEPIAADAELMTGDGGPLVSICKEGIVVAFACQKKNDPSLQQMTIRDGPHPPGVTPEPNAPTITSEMNRLAQSMQTFFKP